MYGLRIFHNLHPKKNSFLLYYVLLLSHILQCFPKGKKPDYSITKLIINNEKKLKQWLGDEDRMLCQAVGIYRLNMSLVLYHLHHSNTCVVFFLGFACSLPFFFCLLLLAKAIYVLLHGSPDNYLSCKFVWRLFQKPLLSKETFY